MGELLKIIGIGVTAAIAVAMLRDLKSEIAILVGIIAGIMILLLAVNMLMGIINTFTGLIEKTGVASPLISSVLKIIGVGYLTEFGAGICEDAGSKSLGDKVAFGGKILILFLALPIVEALLDIIHGLLA